MKNPLHKRLPRDFRSDLGKYAVIFLFLALTISFVSGFLVAGNSMITAYQESFDKYQIEHGHFETTDELPSSVQKTLEDGNKSIYPLYYKDETTGTKKSDTSHTMRLYETRTDVNLICVMDGALPKNDDEIAIDRMYADNNKLSVGDTIWVADQKMKICGLVALSDYSALFSDNNDTMFDAVLFGVACVTPHAFQTFSEDDTHYNYAWRYYKEPKNDTAEQDWSEDFVTLLSEQSIQSYFTIENYIPRFSNQAIQFTGDDMGSDRQMMLVLLYIIVAIMAFVFSVTMKHTIAKESAVIGTLRASGYTKRELFLHYMTMPVLISLLAALLGNIGGYTVVKNLVADLYYGSYSLPTYQTLWNMDAFILTTVFPLIIMFLVNGWVLLRLLTFSPLQFIRRDLSRKKAKRALRLPEFRFFTRFRIRILLQNASSYLTLVFGMIFASILMMFGLMMQPLLTDYQTVICDNMIANYQYILKNQVETDNPNAEKYCLSSLSYHSDERKEDIQIYGIKDHSHYVKQSMPEHGVLVSNAFSEKYGVKKGDSIKLYEPFGSDTYQMLVTDVIEYPSSLAIFMSYRSYLDTFDPEVDMLSNLFTDPDLFLKQLASPNNQEYFTGYFSNEKLTDIDDAYIASCITKQDLTKLSRQLEVSMGSIFGMIKYFAMGMSMILIYLLTKIILEKNSTSISMVKILGYKNSEIARLYLVSTTFVVLLSIFIGMAASTWFIIGIWRFFMMSFNGWISAKISPIVYPEMFLLMLFGYLIVACLQFRKIQHIPMESALKNVE